MNLLVSIVVPIYNIEKYVIFCIESILTQSYRDFELVLVEDGSPDNCGAICDRYAAKDNRVRVIHQKNRGLSGARNAGLEASNGALIMFVDGDDIIEEHMLEILVRDFQENPDIVYAACQHQRIQSYKMEQINRSGVEICETKQTAINLLWGSYENISACGKLYDRDAIGSLRFSEGRIHFEDKAFLLEFLLNNQGKVISERKDELYGYYIRENSITTSQYTSHVLDVLFHAEHIRSVIQEKLTDFLYLADRFDVVAHLFVLKSIVRSHAYHQERETFNRVKREVLKKYGSLPRKVLGNYRTELDTLKICNCLYICCVYAFDTMKRL